MTATNIISETWISRQISFVLNRAAGVNVFCLAIVVIFRESAYPQERDFEEFQQI
jgi:hypothetical protein